MSNGPKRIIGSSEEEEHVALLLEWQERFPKPDKGWDDDLDPPTMLE